MTVYEEIFEVIKKRKAEFDSGTAQENSYTCYLFEKGVDKICCLLYTSPSPRDS